MHMPLSGKTIMLVDDDSDILTVTRMLLEHYNAKVECFSKPDEALERIKTQPDAYDLVITDLADKIHTVRASEPVLYMTAFDIDKELAGANLLQDIVAKPLDTSNFCSRLKSKLAIN